jgi:histidine ammonia-lyase
MSDNESTQQDSSANVPEYKVFAFVVGTDVGWITRVDTRVEQAIASMSSNPVVVAIPDELVSEINYNWSYNGSTFTPPE